MHIETWAMPGGWVGSRTISDLYPADVQDALVAALVAAGWTIKQSYRASYRFGQLFSTTTPPTTAIKDSDKTQAGCGPYDIPHDYISLIDGKRYVEFDPFRQLPPPSPCKGFPLGETPEISAQNFANVASGSPYTVKRDGIGPHGIGLGFTAVAKQPGARGDLYQFAVPIGEYDERLGLDAYPGFLLESPPDVGGRTFQIHLWDGWVNPGGSPDSFNHCFQVYDSYGGVSAPFSLWDIVRSHGTKGVPLRPGGNGWYYRYEIIATKDSLLVIPFERFDVNYAQEVISSGEVYHTNPAFTMGCLYIARPVVTQEALDSGVEASLFCHLPQPSYGYDEMNRLWGWAILQGLNEQLELNNSRPNWSAASLVFPTFRSAVNEPKIRTVRGDTMQSSVYAMAAQSDSEEAGLVGALNSMIAIADCSYTDISQARMQTKDGHWWKLVFQNKFNNTEGFFYNFSLWMAESPTENGIFYDPEGTTTETPRPLSATLNPSNNWTLFPNSESGNDAILFAGGEGLLTITLLSDDAGWPIQAGSSYPTGDPGTIYWDVITAIPNTLGRYVRVWGYPDCARVGHSYTYTFRATDNNGAHIDKSLTVTVAEGTAVSMQPPSSALVATKCVLTNFDWSIGCPGGTVALTAMAWTLHGTIPPGMTFSPSPGTTTIVAELHGTPTTDGYYEFSIAASDPTSGLQMAWGIYKLTVNPNPGVTC